VWACAADPVALIERARIRVVRAGDAAGLFLVRGTPCTVIAELGDVALADRAAAELTRRGHVLAVGVEAVAQILRAGVEVVLTRRPAFPFLVRRTRCTAVAVLGEIARADRVATERTRQRGQVLAIGVDAVTHIVGAGVAVVLTWPTCVSRRMLAVVVDAVAQIERAPVALVLTPLTVWLLRIRRAERARAVTEFLQIARAEGQAASSV